MGPLPAATRRPAPSKPLSYKITMGYQGSIGCPAASVPAPVPQRGGYYYTEGE